MLLIQSGLCTVYTLQSYTELPSMARSIGSRVPMNQLFMCMNHEEALDPIITMSLFFIPSMYVRFFSIAFPFLLATHDGFQL